MSDTKTNIIGFPNTTDIGFALKIGSIQQANDIIKAVEEYLEKEKNHILKSMNIIRFTKTLKRREEISWGLLDDLLIGFERFKRNIDSIFRS